jgi:hypothetical protein
MSLDGLRAWIGEVERKLGIRTKVMLALAAIAIALAGAAIYLAIDTREGAVSESDVQQLQGDLETQIDSGASGGTAVPTLEAEIDALRAQVEELEAGGKKGGGAGSGGAGTGSLPTPGLEEDFPNSAKP